MSGRIVRGEKYVLADCLDCDWMCDSHARPNRNGVLDAMRYHVRTRSHRVMFHTSIEYTLSPEEPAS